MCISQLEEDASRDPHAGYSSDKLTASKPRAENIIPLSYPPDYNLICAPRKKTLVFVMPILLSHVTAFFRAPMPILGWKNVCFCRCASADSRTHLLIDSHTHSPTHSLVCLLIPSVTAPLSHFSNCVPKSWREGSRQCCPMRATSLAMDLSSHLPWRKRTQRIGSSVSQAVALMTNLCSQVPWSWKECLSAKHIGIGQTM